MAFYMIIGECVAHVLGFGFWESATLFSTRRERLVGLQCTRECAYMCVCSVSVGSYGILGERA